MHAHYMRVVRDEGRQFFSRADTIRIYINVKNSSVSTLVKVVWTTVIKQKKSLLFRTEQNGTVSAPTIRRSFGDKIELQKLF